MTRKEIGEMVAAIPQGLDADEFIYKLVKWAVDREREACAKVCEDLIGTRAMARHCADHIRARGEK